MYTHTHVCFKYIHIYDSLDYKVILHTTAIFNLYPVVSLLTFKLSLWKTSQVIYFFILELTGYLCDESSI